LDGFVDVLARRTATFDCRPISAAKSLINDVSLPSADRLLDGLTSFTTALTWPEAQQRFQALFKRGLNQPGDMEDRYGELLGTLMDTSKGASKAQAGPVQIITHDVTRKYMS